jgi:hypothetical protein
VYEGKPPVIEIIPVAGDKDETVAQCKGGVVLIRVPPQPGLLGRNGSGSQRPQDLGSSSRKVLVRLKARLGAAPAVVLDLCNLGL